jgi:4-amino-4-deoxy-L-arabinose transferase-like glycosyltransferase
VDRSVAQGGRTDAAHDLDALRVARVPWLAVAVGVGLAIVAFAIYSITRIDRYYDHFVWQAAAFLEGQAAIRYPVGSGELGIGNWYFQDVLPVAPAGGSERGLIPFPPLPALLLVPFVAVFGLQADDQLIFTALAALDVAICWWMTGRLSVGALARVATTVFFAFGTVFWYGAQQTTTWYQAHIVGVGLTMLAVGLAAGWDDSRVTGRLRRRSIDPRAFGIGLLIGLATTARLTVILALPFFALIGPGGGWKLRSWSMGLGAAIPLGLLLAYNVATTGHVFHPAYDHLYRLEARAYVGLGYHPDWSAEDPRYVPQNLGIMLFTGPDILPDRLRDTLGTMDRPLCTEPGASRGLFDVRCPLAVPRDIGMSVLLTSPAYLLAIAAFRAPRRRRLALAATAAILLVSFANLMHFSQGWVQFGYRFSNDVVPFALVLVALGLDRLAAPQRERGTDRADRDRSAPSWAVPLAIGLVVASIAINAWGVIWGRMLGW